MKTKYIYIYIYIYVYIFVLSVLACFCNFIYLTKELKTLLKRQAKQNECTITHSVRKQTSSSMKE